MTTYAFQQNKFIFIFAGLMLLAGAIYFGYQFLETAFLSEQEGVGKVTGKEHVPFHQEYRSQNIGGVNRTVEIAVPETWLLIVDLDGSQTKAGVDHNEFQSMETGTQVTVRFKKRRISGSVQVTQYLGRGDN